MPVHVRACLACPSTQMPATDKAAPARIDAIKTPVHVIQSVGFAFSWKVMLVWVGGRLKTGLSRATVTPPGFTFVPVAAVLVVHYLTAFLALGGTIFATQHVIPGGSADGGVLDAYLADHAGNGGFTHLCRHYNIGLGRTDLQHAKQRRAASPRFDMPVCTISFAPQSAHFPMTAVTAPHPHIIR